MILLRFSKPSVKFCYMQLFYIYGTWGIKETGLFSIQTLKQEVNKVGNQSERQLEERCKLSTPRILRNTGKGYEHYVGWRLMSAYLENKCFRKAGGVGRTQWKAFVL